MRKSHVNSLLVYYIKVPRSNITPSAAYPPPTHPKTLILIKQYGVSAEDKARQTRQDLHDLTSPSALYFLRFCSVQSSGVTFSYLNFFGACCPTVRAAVPYRYEQITALPHHPIQHNTACSRRYQAIHQGAEMAGIPAGSGRKRGQTYSMGNVRSAPFLFS